MSLILALFPAFAVAAVLTLVEAIVRPARSDWWRNLQAWALYTIAAVTLMPMFSALKVPTLIDASAMPLWLGAALFILVRDAFEYLFHRAQHSVPLLWSMHSLHHSDPEMSALTTQRHYWADQLVKGAVIWPLAGLVMAPSLEMMQVYAVVSLWNFVVHARLPIDFGRLSWLLNTPAYHRRHHSRLPEHYNSNFAALFPVFDVIGSSYYRPNGFPPTGLDTQPNSLSDLIAWPLRHRGDEPDAITAN